MDNRKELSHIHYYDYGGYDYHFCYYYYHYLELLLPLLLHYSTSLLRIPPGHKVKVSGDSAFSQQMDAKAVPAKKIEGGCTRKEVGGSSGSNGKPCY